MLFSACSGGDEKNNQIEIVEDFFEFQKFNLKDFGLNATIMLPDETANIGASTRPEVKHAEDGFKWEIEVGPNFHMIIDDFGEEKNKVADKKRKLKELDIFETKFLVDEKDFIIYESTLKVDGEKASPITDPKPHVSYHVYGQKVIDGYTYVFRSREEGYPKNIIDLMAKSIKSVQEVKNS
jgi:ribosomal protein L7/L12